MSTFDERKKEIVLTFLHRAVQTSQEVAVEKADYSFRLAHHNELFDLLESATASKGVWLFVFEPNDLLADKNTLVAEAMRLEPFFL